MSGYAIAYRLGVTPWERYATEAAAGTGAVLDRVAAGRPRPPGRPLDLGCGRGLHTAELARRGWEAVGELSTFDLFLDIGCVQGLRAAQREAEGRSVIALARPGAELLVLAFGPTRLRSVLGGVSAEAVRRAFAGWEPVSDEPADTAGLGRATARTAPRWYRLHRPVERVSSSGGPGDGGGRHGGGLPPAHLETGPAGRVEDTHPPALGAVRLTHLAATSRSPAVHLLP